jgi:L-serine dehydratase
MGWMTSNGLRAILHDDCIIMESLFELYRIGHGPSSSHTMGPYRAAEIFRNRYLQANRFHVTLFGSLAATGKGHLTDAAIIEAFSPKRVQIDWEPEIELPAHPNGLVLEALDSDGITLGSWQVYSTGGGALREDGETFETRQIYYMDTMRQIMKHCDRHGFSFWEYVEKCEGEEIWTHLKLVWQAMRDSIERGLNAEGVLPGGLGLARKAWAYYRKMAISGPNFLQSGYISAYALAVAEENATGGVIVTAPTCGSAGVLPAALLHMQDHLKCRDDSILHALATAGLIGNLIKFNASISGAEVGCQGEIGAACAMAAGAATQLLGGTIHQIEYAAEMGLEHHLGLTCDPVNGLVQIPCIERNVFAAARAVTCAHFASLSDGTHRVSFDEVIEVMKQTGNDLPSLYRETATGGLAKNYRFPIEKENDGSISG